MDNFANAPSLSDMLLPTKDKLLLYGLWNKPSLLDSESRYSLSGSNFSHSDDRFREVQRRGVLLPQKMEIMQNHMSRASGASNMELPSAAFSRNHSMEGIPYLREDPRADRSAYSKDLDTAGNFNSHIQMQSASRMPDLGNYVSHKASDGQLVFSNLANKGSLIQNGQGDGILFGPTIGSQVSSSSLTSDSRKSLLEDLRLLQILRSARIPNSSQATKTSLPEEDLSSFRRHVSKDLQEDQSMYRMRMDDLRETPKISEGEKKKIIEAYLEDRSKDQRPSWSDVDLWKEKYIALSSASRKARSERRTRSPQKMRHSSPRGFRKLGSRSPIRNHSRSPIGPLSISPRRYRSRSPLKYRMVSRSPNQHRSQSPIQTLSGGRYHGIYRSQSPRRYRSRSPESYKSRSPGGYRNMSPGTYRRGLPSMYKGQSPGKYKSRSPQRYRRRSPPKYRSRSPPKYRSRSPGMCESHGSGMYRSRSPTGYRSKSPEAYRSGSSPSHRSRSSTHWGAEISPMNPIDVTSPYKLIGALCLIESAISQANTHYVLQIIHKDIIKNVFTMPYAAKSAMFLEGFELKLEVVPAAHARDWRDPLYHILDSAYERKLDMDVYVEARAHDDEMDIRGAQAFELAEYFRGSNIVIAIAPLEVWERRVQESGKKKKKKKKKGNAAPETLLMNSQDETRPGVHSRFGSKTLGSRPREPFLLEDKMDKWKNVQSRLGERVKERETKDRQWRVSLQERLGARKNVLSRLGDRVDPEAQVIVLDSD